MADESNKNVSTVKSILSSIKTDWQVFQWVDFLIHQTPLQSELSTIKEFATLYQEIRLALITKILVNFSLLGVFLFSVMTKQYYYLGVCLILFGVSLFIDSKHRNRTTQVFRHVLTTDYDEPQIFQMTLYQISEIYSKKFSIASLTDAISRIEKITCMVVVLAFTAFVFVYPVFTYRTYPYIALLYALLRAFICLPKAYQHIITNFPS